MSLDGCPRCFGDDAAKVWDDHGALDLVARVADESHFVADVLACPCCGQRFASLFCERIDWQGGNDPQDWLLVPLSADEASAVVAAGEQGAERVLSSLTAPRRFLLRYYPASSNDPEVGWRDGRVIVPPHD
jgi:hypothetical protein